ncbi:ATP-dependent DNA helicase DinG [Virgibacillus byunsanensis]|uniref:3'-5' exonuclease DinG n=1 Tax=Virgibacillus byunsanensis TaxID=570945 RepID=A0ABW3LLV3_9BACI
MDKYVVIDLETTGHSPAKSDKIIEVGLVIIEDDVIVDEFSTLLNPNQPIPPFISNLTGIHDEDVAYAPTFHEQASDIAEMCKDSYLIAHNVPFDLGFINEEFAGLGMERLTNPVIDTVELARILYPQSPSFKLGQLTEYLDIHHSDPHRALSDAFVTAKLFLKMKQKINQLPFETVSHLLHLEKSLKSDLSHLLDERHHALAFSLQKRDDMDTYGGLAYKKMVDHSVTEDEIETPFGIYLDDIYETNGSMHQFMDNYEKRSGQREMSETIYDAFQSKSHALIEAETGTGKSLAYLIPAIYEAALTQKRIIISTYTTQLQSQLLEEEIPLISKLVSIPFKVALLKGKQHYISLEKFAHELASEQQENYDVILTKAMILVWLTETETGDIDEIQLPSSGYLFYKKISTDSEGIMDPHSPWFSRSFYQKARKKAQQANVVITNHALLCTDMFNDYQFLPAYEKAIVDEAHHLEETASKHYGLKLDYVTLQYSLNQIGTIEEDNFIGKLIKKYSVDENHPLLEKWNDMYGITKHETDDLFRTIFQYVYTQHKNDKSLSDIGRIQYRFDLGKENSAKWNTVVEMATRLTFFLRDLIHMLSNFKEYLEKMEHYDRFDNEDILNCMNQLQSLIDRVEKLFIMETPKTEVKWIEIEASGARNAVYLYSEPTDISDFLHEDFFAKKKSVILTSATLTMKSSFSFIQDRLGLQSENVVTMKINSPFSYENQVQLMVPNDFPDIKYGNMDDFIYSVCEAILSLAEVTKGRMLVLFTSYEMLRKSYTLLKETIDINSYMLIAQGISSGSRARLKKNFQTFDQSILLGTSSFWEGVDIPGEDLSCLMIVRLPFQPPNHPIYEAKSSYLKQKGKNAFMELSLPNAVIRFKQGFGRLIRSSSDRGIVFVCDARIIKARYGKYFIDSIPNVPITHDSTQQLIEKAEKWF